MTANSGRKDDAGKLPWHLLPFDAIRGTLTVLDYGQRKYAPRNWEHGMDWDRPFAAAMRHLSDWYDGADLDPETGLSHLDHALCCILFLSAYTKRGVGTDTRPLSVLGALSATAIDSAADAVRRETEAMMAVSAEIEPLLTGTGKGSRLRTAMRAVEEQPE